MIFLFSENFAAAASVMAAAAAAVVGCGVTRPEDTTGEEVEAAAEGLPAEAVAPPAKPLRTAAAAA